MKNTLIASLLIAGFAGVSLTSSVCASEALPIRNRTQWLENNGYCGETSLQECALYFGIYASQAYIRGIYDPTQQNDLVEAAEWAQVLPAIGLRADFFRTDLYPSPQYRRYEVWMKQQLEKKHPVISTCYLFFGVPTDPVDHIISITGFNSENVNQYRDLDTFDMTHHLARETEGLPGAPFSFSQRAKWLFDDRAMQSSGAIYGYAIQKEVNYGLAIKGTLNEAPEALPVRVELDKIIEPNLIAGEVPSPFQASIRVEDLVPGKNYVLYRYNDPARVPRRNYASRPSSSRVAFRAKSRNQVFTDTIQSDSIAIFRCLPAGK